MNLESDHSESELRQDRPVATASMIDADTLVLYPYRDGDRWLFRDNGEVPLPTGLDHLIDALAREAGCSGGPLRLTFSTCCDGKEKRASARLAWIGNDESASWNLYEVEGDSVRGWLAPELAERFRCAPRRLLVAVEPLTPGWHEPPAD
ncbi:MAG: hypothetical protein WBX15_00785 [Thermoanaerobaculia bacterium]